MITFASERRGVKIEHTILGDEYSCPIDLLEEFCRFMQSLTFAEETVRSSVKELAEAYIFEDGDVGEV